MDRSDAEDLGRDDPGAIWPEKVTAADVVQDGAEVVLVGHRSTQWYSGANTEPMTLVPGRSATKPGSRIDEILHGVRLGQEIGFDEIVVTVAFLANHIKTYFGDGAEFGVTMRYADEPVPLGTAADLATGLLHGDTDSGPPAGCAAATATRDLLRGELFR
eukprot:gene23443-43961_t